MLTGFFKYVLDLILEFIVKKGLELYKSIEEKRSQSKVTEGNLKLVKEEPDVDKKIDKQIDLLNGNTPKP
jgi:hypothetical protein